MVTPFESRPTAESDWTPEMVIHGQRAVEIYATERRYSSTEGSCWHATTGILLTYFYTDVKLVRSTVQIEACETEAKTLGRLEKWFNCSSGWMRQTSLSHLFPFFLFSCTSHYRIHTSFGMETKIRSLLQMVNDLWNGFSFTKYTLFQTNQLTTAPYASFFPMPKAKARMMMMMMSSLAMRRMQRTTTLPLD